MSHSLLRLQHFLDVCWTYSVLPICASDFRCWSLEANLWLTCLTCSTFPNLMQHFFVEIPSLSFFKPSWPSLRNYVTQFHHRQLPSTIHWPKRICDIYRTVCTLLDSWPVLVWGGFYGMRPKSSILVWRIWMLHVRDGHRSSTLRLCYYRADCEAGDVIVRVRSKKDVGGWRRKESNLYWREIVGVDQVRFLFSCSSWNRWQGFARLRKKYYTFGGRNLLLDRKGLHNQVRCGYHHVTTLRRTCLLQFRRSHLW